MARKRFALLAGVLVTLNLVLWLAPAGIALRNDTIAKLFGPRLIRAEVIDKGPGGTTVDTRVDRGIIVAASATELTLSEADGRQQTIGLGDSTVVLGHKRRLPLLKLVPGWRVRVTWQATGTTGLATEVRIEARRHAKARLKGASPNGASLRHTAEFHLS